MSLFVQAVAAICLIWSVIVVVIETLGIRAIFRDGTRKPDPPVSPKLREEAPRVTIIRPVKGLEPQLYDCIASTFQQDYPRERMSIRLCVDSASDPAYPVLKQLVEDFPTFDVKVLVESDDPYLHGPEAQGSSLGPNPKIRNISRAYREAGDDDVIWITDCNVWATPGALGRLVDKLMGYTPSGQQAQPCKFVHQMPIVVDIVDYSRPLPADTSVPSPSSQLLGSDTPSPGATARPRIAAHGGGRLDEMFMATTHAKFYAAINYVGVAPCVVGKSNMFRKSHLDYATTQAELPASLRNSPRSTGVDYFSHQICEDHLIGDLLWKTPIAGHLNHGLVWGDIAVQPMAGMSVAAYAARRARWLRARKFTVLLATLVEPGVESFLCCAYMAFALTTLPWFHDTLGVPQTWLAMSKIWLACVLCWMTADWAVFHRLHAGHTMDQDEKTPFFARGAGRTGGIRPRSIVAWLPAWIGRESLALPIWFWAVVLGRTVNWRGQSFRVRFDTTVVVAPKRKRLTKPMPPDVARARLASQERRN